MTNDEFTAALPQQTEAEQLVDRWIDEMQQLIQTCEGGAPRCFWFLSTDLSEEPQCYQLRAPASRRAGLAYVRVIAGSEAQAATRFKDWRRHALAGRSGQDYGPVPSAPVPQAWWPEYLRNRLQNATSDLNRKLGE